MDEIRKFFKEPPREYGPTPFFALNSDLDPGALVAALSEMAKGGVAGVFLHPRSGLEIEYLSEPFFERIGIAIETCARLGINAWLYDEYNWPSGPAAGKVLLEHPEFRQKYLEFLRVKKPRPDKLIKLPGKLVAAFSCGEKITPVEIENKNGQISVPRLSGEALVFYESECRDRMFFNSCAPWLKPAPGYIDLMNPEAAQEFIRLTHEQYAQRFSAHFGKTVPGIFTDEPQQYDGFPWSQFFRGQFMAKYGHDPVKQLYLLVLDRDNFMQFRSEYYGLAGRLMDEGYYRPISRWCSEHGLIFTGHLGMEERITQIAVNHGGVYHHLSEMQMPGIDALNVGEGISGGLGNMEAPNFAVKMAGSIALASGAKRVLCETGGGAGWQMTLIDFKRMCDWLFSLGVNFLNPHHSLMSIKGLRKRDFPPSHFWQEPWWEYYPEFSKYVSRVCRLLSEGERTAEIAVLIPSSTFKALCRGRGFRTGELSELSLQIEELTRILVQSQREHDYIFEESISQGKAKVESGKIRFADHGYSLLIVPAASVLHKDSLSLVENFLDQGGRVFFLGPLPEHDCDGNETAGFRARVINYKDRVKIYPDFATAPPAVAEALARMADAKLQLTPSLSAGIVLHSRVIDGDEIFFLSNLSSSHLRVGAFLKTARSGLEVFYPWDGSSRKLPFKKKAEGLSFSIDFTPLESLVLVASDKISPSWIEETDLALTEFDDEKVVGFYPPQGASLKTAGKEIKLAAEPALPPPISLHGPFEFEALSPNVLRLGPWRVKAPRTAALAVDGLNDELLFSRQARVLARLLRPAVSLLNIILRPDSKYRELMYEDFGDIEKDMDRASKTLGIDFRRMGLYQTIDTLFRFSEYLPLRTDFRVFPPPGAEYQAKTSFYLDQAPPKLELVFEDLGQPISFTINGRELKTTPRRERVWDDSNLIFEITEHVRKGKNHLSFQSRQLSFPCLFPSFHTIEPVILRGDFEVDKKQRVAQKEPSKGLGDLCGLGYPHYSGKVKYTTEVELEPKHLECYLLLECSEAREQLELRVNGKPAGLRIGPPHQFPIRHLASAGKNKIEFIVSNTAANLLSRPEPTGLIGPVTIWPFHFYSKKKEEIVAPQ